MVGVATLGAWSLTWLAGGAQHIPPHLFYVPVLLAATWLGPLGIVLAAILAAVVAGPLLPADVASGTPQMATDWIVRGVFFVSMGQMMGVLIRSLLAAKAREQSVAEREAALAARKTAILKGLSHELRTPLSILVGATQMLQKPELSARVRAELWPAHLRALRRLETLVDVAVVLNDDDRTLNDSSFEIGPVVEDQLSALSRVDADRVTFTHGADALVRGDTELVGLLLRILIDNALRYSPAQEPVHVTATWNQDGRVTVSIADRGPGIDPTDVGYMMEAFVQGHDDASTVNGLGLGLAAASRIATHLRTELRFSTGHPGDPSVTFTLQGADRPGLPAAGAGRRLAGTDRA